MLSKKHGAGTAKGSPKRAYAGASAESRRLKRREKLLDAAKKVFGERGFTSATVRIICGEAGLTERYFYESFANSEALFIAMHKRTSERIIARLRAASEEASASDADRVTAIVATYFADIQNDPVSARLFAVDAGYISPVANEVCATWRANFGQLLEDATGDGVRCEHALLRTGVVKGLLGIGVDWMDSGFAAPESEVVAAGVRLVSAL